MATIMAIIPDAIITGLTVMVVMAATAILITDLTVLIITGIITIITEDTGIVVIARRITTAVIDAMRAPPSQGLS
jgi:hypothetical protein